MRILGIFLLTAFLAGVSYCDEEREDGEWSASASLSFQGNGRGKAKYQYRRGDRYWVMRAALLLRAKPSLHPNFMNCWTNWRQINPRNKNEVRRNCVSSAVRAIREKYANDPKYIKCLRKVPPMFFGFLSTGQSLNGGALSTGEEEEDEEENRVSAASRTEKSDDENDEEDDDDDSSSKEDEEEEDLLVEDEDDSDRFSFSFSSVGKMPLQVRYRNVGRVDRGQAVYNVKTLHLTPRPKEGYRDAARVVKCAKAAKRRADREKRRAAMYAAIAAARAARNLAANRLKARRLSKTNAYEENLSLDRLRMIEASTARIAQKDAKKAAAVTAEVRQERALVARLRREHQAARAKMIADHKAAWDAKAAALQRKVDAARAKFLATERRLASLRAQARAKRTAVPIKGVQASRGEEDRRVGKVKNLFWRAVGLKNPFRKREAKITEALMAKMRNVYESEARQVANDEVKSIARRFIKHYFNGGPEGEMKNEPDVGPTEVYTGLANGTPEMRN